MPLSVAKKLCFCFTVFALLHEVYNRGDKLTFSDGASSMMSELGMKPTDRHLNRRSPARDNNLCDTEVGEKGNCLPIEKCPELLNFIKSRNGIHTPGTAAFIRKRICRFVGRDAHTCCVPQDSSATPVPVSPPGELTRPKPFDPAGKLPSLDECGLSFGIKVRGGNDFNHGSHPWLVGIGYPKGKNEFHVECGGTLITNKHVLTAAHCFEEDPNAHRLRSPPPDLTHVILGEHSLSKNTERMPPEVLRIVLKKNPGYNASIHYHDISLLTLEKEIEFTSYISPACLPAYSHIEHFDLNRKMTVAGWGRMAYDDLHGTDEPLEAKLSLVSKPKCRKAYDFAPEVPLDKTQICLVDKEKDACKGDSGGPLIYTDTGKYYRKFVIGVVAFGVKCGDPMYPGIYTFVPAYADWIVENL